MNEANDGTNGLHVHERGSRALHLAQHVLILIFAVLALLALGFGSFIVGETVLGAPDPTASPGAQAEVPLYASYLLWPLAMIVVWLCGAIALIAARRYFNIIYWFVVCLLAAFGGLLLPSTFFVIPLLLIFDAGIVYSGWRLVFM